ncbi:MAG: hypothetical protein R2781_03290 [Flavobacteriaceae bacterium]
MRKIIIPFLLIVLTLSLSACLGNSEKKNAATGEYRTETALGLYEMQVPEFMKATTGLNTDASMQFQNIYKETYLAVIEESKDDFINTFKDLNEYDESKSPAENYQTIQVDFFTEEMQITRKERPVKMKINGMDAEQVEFVGRVAGIDFDIYYLMTFIEGKETLYMIMEWTLSSNENTYKDTFKYMANSFKEL